MRTAVTKLRRLFYRKPHCGGAAKKAQGSQCGWRKVDSFALIASLLRSLRLGLKAAWSRNMIVSDCMSAMIFGVVVWNQRPLQNHFNHS